MKTPLRTVSHAKHSLSEATAIRDERIKTILETGLKNNRISSIDIETFYKLRSSFESHNDPKTYKAMQEILEKARD